MSHRPNIVPKLEVYWSLDFVPQGKADEGLGALWLGQGCLGSPVGGCFSLKLTASLHLKIGHPKRKGSASNHQFSGCPGVFQSYFLRWTGVWMVCFFGVQIYTSSRLVFGSLGLGELLPWFLLFQDGPLKTSCKLGWFFLHKKRGEMTPVTPFITIAERGPILLPYSSMGLEYLPTNLP